MPSFAPVVRRTDATLDGLAQAVAEATAPVVFTGLVAEWPAVRAARQSDRALIDYLKARDNGAPAPTLRKGGDGRFFYNETLDGFNFQRANVPLSLTLDMLGRLAPDSQDHIYIQSVPLREHLPAVRLENRLPEIVAEPRIWIGNASVTRTHFDLFENLVCMVAGAKRFVLFPPEQLPNLYMGPLENTVSGVPASMVDLDQPDFARYPRFRQALEAALVAELEPGDVLYVPYMWWHHVASVGGFNVQINYWWNEVRTGGTPMQALILTLLAVRDLPPERTAAWKVMFDTLVFQVDGPAGDHLPEDRRGLLGEMTPEMRLALRKQLGKNLAED